MPQPGRTESDYLRGEWIEEIAQRAAFIQEREDDRIGWIWALKMIAENVRKLDETEMAPSRQAAWAAAINTDVTTQASGYINFEPCATVWSLPINDYRNIADACSAYPGYTNSRILSALYAHTAEELFAEIFEENETKAGQAPLEQALGYLPAENSYMQKVIANGHP